MNAKRKHQQGLRPKSGNLRRTRGRQEFFDLARNVYVPDEFMAERDDTRPQEQRLFDECKVSRSVQKLQRCAALGIAIEVMYICGFGRARLPAVPNQAQKNPGL